MNSILITYDAIIPNMDCAISSPNMYYYTASVKEAGTEKERFPIFISYFPVYNTLSVFTQKCIMEESAFRSLRGKKVAITTNRRSNWE